jgi:D-serine deaminase-like pyridoxal phosphate-dependent protein
MGYALERSAEQLRFGIAEQVAERGIDSQEPAFRRNDNHSYAGVLKGSAEPFLGIAERFLRAAPFRNIHDGSEKPFFAGGASQL